MNKLSFTTIFLTTVLFCSMYCESLSVEQFITNNSCYIHSTRYDYDGFVPVTLNWIRCPSNVYPSMFVRAKCSSRCKNPVTGNDLSTQLYTTKEVKYAMRFEVRKSNRVETETITSVQTCRCVKR
ncbi:uncharacterized protein LOC120338063 [Styela clava]